MSPCETPHRERSHYLRIPDRDHLHVRTVPHRIALLPSFPERSHYVRSNVRTLGPSQNPKHRTFALGRPRAPSGAPTTALPASPNDLRFAGREHGHA